MNDPLILAAVSFAAFALNLGAGRLRAGTAKFSIPWFLWIHAPIVAIVPLRLWLGLSAWAIPLLVAVSVAGQWVGGRMVHNT